MPDRPWLHLLRRAGERGLGAAYRAGFAWALERTYSYVAEMDADLSHDPGDLPRLLAAAHGGADLSLGSRYVPGGGAEGWPLRRRLLSRAANLFARALLRLPVRDATGGFRIYSRRAVHLLLEGTTECQGYGFQVEGVHTVISAGLSATEVPIIFRDRTWGDSKMSTSTAIEAAQRCFALGFRSGRVRHSRIRASQAVTTS
jgi:dolichol-phosphate mannosyltransferase